MTVASDFLRAGLDPAELFRQAFGSDAHDWQRDYLRETRNTITFKGRQVGASQAAAGKAIHSCRYYPNTNAVIVSPTLKQSTEITTKARVGLYALGIQLIQDSASVIRLANGSRIVSLPGTPRSVRGWTARLLILDEAAYIEPETFTAARALVATGGQMMVQSTPAEEVGDFFELVSDPPPTWRLFNVPSDSVPTISREFLDSERRAMSPDEYAREYECAFGKAGASLFSLNTINSLVMQAAS
jgi:Terminase large subunit, T4likevirus-type, N-terminal